MEVIFLVLVLAIGYGLWEFRNELRRLADFYAVPKALNTPGDDEIVSGWKEWNNRKEQFRQQLDARIGARAPSDALNYEILQAQKVTPKIRRIVQEELPTSIRRCMVTHRLSALMAGVEYLEEIADQPECFAHRERVVEVGGAAVEMIEGFRLLPDQPELVGKLLLIREGILPTCRDCSYLRYRTHAVPVLCPSAKLAGIRAEDLNHHDRPNPA